MIKELLTSIGVTISDAARMLGIRRETLHRKIVGKQPFYLREAVTLYRTFFPKEDFWQVFSEYYATSKEDGILLDKTSETG
ncbi:helix-turn-helix domain-containing protein [Anaerotignum sp.]